MTTTTRSTVYQIGGPRYEDGRSHPINQNDRQFNCGFGVCSNEYTPHDRINQQDLFNLNFQLLDIEVLRENLIEVSNGVKNAYINILNWLTDLEQSFAIRVETGDVEMNITLFNKLNLVIPKFNMARKVMDSWYADYIDMETELSDLFSDYSNSAAKIQLLSSQNTSVSGLKESVITLAKQNMSKSKAIQRTITKILSLDTQIRNAFQMLTFKMSELTSGILRYGPRNEKKILNLTEMSNAVMSLGEGESPLTRIQTQLSNLINSTPLNFDLKTREIPRLKEINYDPKDKFDIKELSAEMVVEKLNAIKEITLYTETTKSTIDSLKRYIDDKFKNDLRYQTMNDIINKIKTENVPNRFIDNLTVKSTDANNIYLTVDIIRRTIDKLSGVDLTYRTRLNEILKQATNTARNLVGVVPMEVDQNTNASNSGETNRTEADQRNVASTSRQTRSQTRARSQTQNVDGIDGTMSDA